MCCTQLAENTGRKKVAKKSPSGHHRTILLGYMFATKALIDKGEKLVNLINQLRPYLVIR